MLKRVHVRYELQVDDDADRVKIDRAHAVHANHCPVARSIRDAIDVTTELELMRT